MLQIKFNNSLYKITILIYIFLLVVFLNRGKGVAKAYIRVLLFYSGQPFLIFEDLNPISRLKLKTEFTWSFLEGNLV